ncbi:class I SAM-dependent methyltransferase [Vogesella sp. GCM10023246]|uniref:Class I SAM-dependent methyltransferase n=1 Tax=Vogesella oryzagri TaxID=3160864 RepID=A0ABV1MAF7_9NEIS
MSDAADFWTPRFAGPDYAYGDAANDFLREQAGRLSPGSRILSLGEGEGRNAVYLAGLGHQLTAVDAAWTGLAKLLQRAAAANLAITATLADLGDYELGHKQWDAIISVFCHLPSALRRQVLARAVQALKPGGLLIMEGYTPRQLAFGTGGPKETDLLLEPDTLRAELTGLELLHFVELQREVIEGRLHTGMAAVLQVVGRKPD